MLESVEWGEYRLGDLFESYNGDFDIQRSLINDEGDYVITAGQTNNGVLGRSVVHARIFPSGSITVDMFGYAHYRSFDYKLVTHARVFSLIPKFDITPHSGLFISNTLHYLPLLFGYQNMCSWAKIENEYIQLPTRDGKIDYEFMERFISELNAARLAELNAARLAELNAYLSITGLKDYTLTPEEEQVVKDFRAGNVEWGKYRLGDLFGEATRGKRLKSEDRISGNLPFVTAGEANMGISAFIGNEVEVFQPNTITIDMFGSAKYRNYAYGADDHVAVVHTQNLSKHAVCFITSAIHKVANAGDFHYGRNFYAKDAAPLIVSLFECQGSPDYGRMETLISAIEKLVIKDVVLYADREIEATKQVVDKTSKNKPI